MIRILATAHTWRGGDGPYTIAPIAGLLVSLFLLRAFLGARLGPVQIALAAVLGTAFATLEGRWGYVLTLSWWLVAFAIVATVRKAGRLRRNPSD